MLLGKQLHPSTRRQNADPFDVLTESVDNELQYFDRTVDDHHGECHRKASQYDSTFTEDWMA